MAVTLKPTSEIDSDVAARFGSNDCLDGKKPIDLPISNRQPGSMVRAHSDDAQGKGENAYQQARVAMGAVGVEWVGLRDAPWVPPEAELGVWGAAVSGAARPYRILSVESPR